MDKNRLIGPHDASTVDLSDQEEVEYWKKRFAVSEEKLREVVNRVGMKVDDVVKEFEAAHGTA